MIKFLLLISTALCVISLSSCNKEPAHEVDEEFVGGWLHYKNTNESWTIRIDDNSRGSILLYDSLNNFVTKYSENSKKWRVNRTTKTLHHGLYHASFIIIKYPSIATTEIIDGLDTIAQGETYMILDEGYFKRN